MVSIAPWPLYPQERDPVPIARRLGALQGRSKPVQKIFPPTENRSSDCLARRESRAGYAMTAYRKTNGDSLLKGIFVTK